MNAFVADDMDAALAAGAQSLTASDLTELLQAFNEVTTKLQAAHERLRGEVVRLERELRDANEQLRRSERLAALGEMASGIAHEVRNPLASIGLYASMLSDDLEDRPESREIAQKIARAVRGLDAIVGDVLTFSRRIEPRLEHVDASEALGRALEACLPQVEQSGARVARADMERPPLVIKADPALLHQAVVNVLRNAAEAIAECAKGASRAPAREPVITLDAREERVRDENGVITPMVAIVVADTGPGISPEVVSRMFNPFFTTRHTGTGLGLAIVHRIVDAHGGRVRVGENPGGGALLELLIPRTPPQDNDPA